MVIVKDILYLKKSFITLLFLYPYQTSTSSKLSELLMQGTNMGIIEGRRLINQNNNIAQDVKNILNDFVVMQEDSIETLKKYL